MTRSTPPSSVRSRTSMEPTVTASTCWSAVSLSTHRQPSSLAATGYMNIHRLFRGVLGWCYSCSSLLTQQHTRAVDTMLMHSCMHRNSIVSLWHAHAGIRADAGASGTLLSPSSWCLVVCLLTGGGCWLTLPPPQGQIASQRGQLQIESTLLEMGVDAATPRPLHGWTFEFGELALIRRFWPCSGQIGVGIVRGAPNYSKLVWASLQSFLLLQLFYLFLSRQPQQFSLTCFFYSCFSLVEGSFSHSNRLINNFSDEEEKHALCAVTLPSHTPWLPRRGHIRGELWLTHAATAQQRHISRVLICLCEKRL